MNPLDRRELESLHSFYVASNKTDLDEAWEEAKHNAIRALQFRIERIYRLTRADYEFYNGVNQGAA